MLGRTNTGGGGGGGGLNYTVVGGTSAPSNPKENTIWVNTSTEITFHAFQPFTPSNPQEGWVWIKAGTESGVAFNALKKNRIQLYPLSAKQYVSGAWVDKTAKSYIGGKWVDWWNGVLYDAGKTYNEITGGFVAVAGDSSYKPTVTYNSNYISLYQPDKPSTSVNCWLQVKNPIDLGRFTTLKLNVKSFSYGNGANIRIQVRKTANTSDTVVAGTSDSRATGVHSLDVSALTGQHYIYIMLSGVNTTATLEFTKWWLE